MISYAQNFEDVMLRRALRLVETGFYIDVGAADPSVYSVTRAFYDMGWNGINIEPLPHHVAALAEARPRDINLECAAGSHCGTLRLWETDVVGWATARPDFIERLTADGHRGAYLSVEMRTLEAVCAEHAPAAIHFLKIDVEGLERDVLLGCDFSRFRPWIVVVEATRPNSTEETHGEWEGILLAADYRLVYADGLNRFYLAVEHEDLADAFRYPPNVFDRFETYEKVLADVAAHRFKSEAEAALAQTRRIADEAEARVRQAEEAVAATAHRFKSEAEAALAQTRRIVDEAEARVRHAEEVVAATAAEARRLDGLARDAETHALRAVAKAHEAELRALEAEVRGRECEAWAHWAEDRARRAEAQAVAAESQIAELLGSKSWRLTLPLREARLRMRGLTRQLGVWRQGLARNLATVAVKLAHRQALRIGVRRAAARLGIEAPLRRLYRSIAGQRSVQDRSATIDDGSVGRAGYAPMTPHARAIYAVLRSAQAGGQGSSDAHRH